MTHGFPLLEFDPERSALIEPHHTITPVSIPELAVACFFRNVADDLVQRDNAGGESWDHRDWSMQRSIRKSLFFLACEACCEAPSAGTEAKT